MFLGSEGETAVLARRLDDFLWLLAAGVEPYDALVRDEITTRVENGPALAVARRFARTDRRRAEIILDAARTLLPELEHLVRLEDGRPRRISPTG